MDGGGRAGRERKAYWDNVSAAVALAAQRKVQEDKVRLETHSRDQFLLAAIQKPTSFRTKFQRGYCTKEPPHAKTEEDERSRWLHILAGIVLNTDTSDGQDVEGEASFLAQGSVLLLSGLEFDRSVVTRRGSRQHMVCPFPPRQHTSLISFG